MAEKSFFDRLKNAWNVFRTRDEPFRYNNYPEPVSFNNPERLILTRGNERSIINAIFTRIAIDAASITIEHVKLDENGRYSDTINSGLNNVLNLEANIDQSCMNFKEDLVLTLLDEGCVAVVPVDTDIDPRFTDGYDIKTMRVGSIVGWTPTHVRVSLYNDHTGKKEEIMVPKRTTAIIENPFYPIMNEPNSTVSRLIRKLNLLDAIDEQSGAGKLDLIIQLPYTIRSDARREQANERRREIERQLAGSKYGIAYIDGTEHITQINRAVENNLLTQIEYLTNLLYGQLGITESIMNGTANEEQKLEYYNRTIWPLMEVITLEFKRTFLSKTARTRRESIEFFRDPFAMVPASQLADLSDKLTRNEIATSNEMRAIIGWKPSKDPEADELRNKNLNQSSEALKEEQVIGEEDQKLEKEE